MREAATAEPVNTLSGCCMAGEWWCAAAGDGPAGYKQVALCMLEAVVLTTHETFLAGPCGCCGRAPCRGQAARGPALRYRSAHCGRVMLAVVAESASGTVARAFLHSVFP